MSTELHTAMAHDLVNQVGYHLSDWTCARLREGQTIGQLAEAAGMRPERWWAIIKRDGVPELHEVAGMAFALGAQVRVAFPEPDDELPF